MLVIRTLILWIRNSNNKEIRLTTPTNKYWRTGVFHLTYYIMQANQISNLVDFRQPEVTFLGSFFSIKKFLAFFCWGLLQSSFSYLSIRNISRHLFCQSNLFVLQQSCKLIQIFSPSMLKYIEQKIARRYCSYFLGLYVGYTWWWNRPKASNEILPEFQTYISFYW